MTAAEYIVLPNDERWCEPAVASRVRRVVSSHDPGNG
jgi:hypothetical protein